MVIHPHRNPESGHQSLWIADPKDGYIYNPNDGRSLVKIKRPDVCEDLEFLLLAVNLLSVFGLPPHPLFNRVWVRS